MAASDANVTYEPVESSNIAAIGYEIGLGNLWVRFHSGAKYVYYHVPSHLYLDFRASLSKGHFLWLVIRGKGTDSIYAYDKVQ